MLGSGSFMEGEEEEEEGEIAMESSSGSGGGGDADPEQAPGETGEGVVQSGTGSEEDGLGPEEQATMDGRKKRVRRLTQENVDISSDHDRSDAPSNHSSERSACLDSTKSSKLHPDPVSHQTEGSGSEQLDEQGRAQTHKEMMRAMREMKRRLPSEKKGHCKARTVEALRYALSCVKQVQANSEYHSLLLSSRKDKQIDIPVTVCSLDELESVTSEHTLKNTGTFVVVFSLTSNEVVYVSEQASSILGCKRSFLSSARFVELLYHQDVNIFYSHTAQSRLPPWTVGPDRAVLYECTLVKSFFCRIRSGKDSEGEMRYSPFRITPYLLKVQGGEGEEGQPCCLALAERIHSGYEAPRIPLDKRIFTTTHSPGCVFMEVDDRAVPLLGYLPQDLIGSSVLACLHPEDRNIMLALHRKILKYAGQPPFEHSPFRFRCQNGDYVTLDTSWSSFVNPWSRKVAFVIGRHKVRTGPLNEDVFTTQSGAEQPSMLDETRELQAQIYRLFLQPVHNNGSSGYGSMGSNGSHEPYVSMASSSDSNGNAWEDTHREPIKMRQICADINKVKSWGQQAYLDSRCKLHPMERGTAGPTAPPALTPQPMGFAVRHSPPHKDSRKQPHIPSYQQINCVDSIIRYLESYTVPALKRKSECLSITSSSSSSSSASEEDKAPESTMAEGTLLDAVATDAGFSAGSAAAVVGAPLTDLTLSSKALSVVSVTSQCSYSSTIVHVPQPESEVTALEDAPMGSEQADPTPPPSRPQPSLLGLTKEVLSAHTQKEEQEYVDRLRYRILQSPYRSYLQRDGSSHTHSQHHGNHCERFGRRRGRIHEPKLKRRLEQQSSDSYASPLEGHPMAQVPSLSQTESSGIPPLLPPLQAPCFAPTGQQGQATGVTNATLYTGPQPYSLQPDQGFQATPNTASMLPVQGAVPYMAPVMAVILPNFPTFPGYPMYTQGMNPLGVNPLAPATLPLLPQHFNPTSMASSPFPTAATPAIVPQAMATTVPPSTSPRPPSVDHDSAEPNHLFSSSRSSSPLQLNLLQEELPKPAEPPSTTAQTESQNEQHDKEEARSESGNHDGQSTSSEILDMLLQEDARSGTGSNASGSGSGESGGSLGSGSNGTSTSHTGSSNSSKYFASNDSSHTSLPASRGQTQGDQVAEDRANFEQCVENSLWTLIQHTPEPVMMTYQIAPRDQAQVLKEDREKLLLFESMQPIFTEEQRKELAEVHPWIQQQSVPEEINTQGCVTCNPTVNSPPHLTPDSSCPPDGPPPGPGADT